MTKKLQSKIYKAYNHTANCHSYKL